MRLPLGALCPSPSFWPAASAPEEYGRRSLNPSHGRAKLVPGRRGTGTAHVRGDGVFVLLAVGAVVVAVVLLLKRARDAG